MRWLVVEARGAGGGADEARSPSRLPYRLQKSTNPHMGPSPRDFSGGPRTACDICLQKSTKIYMRTCAREFRRGRPSARYKAARNGPAPEKERRFGAFSLPRFRPFSSHVLRSVRPRSDRSACRAADPSPLPTCMWSDPDPVVRHATDDRSRFSAVLRIPTRSSGEVGSKKTFGAEGLFLRVALSLQLCPELHQKLAEHVLAGVFFILYLLRRGLGQAARSESVFLFPHRLGEL